MTDQTTLPNDVDTIKAIVKGLVEAMGFVGTVEGEETITKGLVVNIDIGPESYLLIGKLGANLHALENLAQTLSIKALGGKFVRFSLDVDDYRRKREWYLKETVKQALGRAKVTGRPVALLPMPNYERRFVHSLVTEMEPTAVTTSTGYEPRRRVVIKLT